MDNIEKISILDDLLQQLHILLFNEDKKSTYIAIDQIMFLMNALFELKLGYNPNFSSEKFIKDIYSY